MNPTEDDLIRYGMNQEIESGEKPLWLGVPDMRYVFVLAAPTTLLFMAAIAGYFRIMLGFGYNLPARPDIAMIVFDCAGAFALIITVLSILPLRHFIYLVSDRNIYVSMKNVNLGKLLYLIRKHGRIIKYDLSKLVDLEFDASVLCKDVGNIYLENSIYDDGVFFRCNTDHKNDVEFRKRTFPIRITTRVKLANVLYAVYDVPSVSEMLRSAINNARKRS